MSAVIQKVDLLAVINEAMAYTDDAFPLLYAHEAVVELFAAIFENRSATEAFAQDGCPENYVRFDDSERRLLRALANVGATP